MKKLILFKFFIITFLSQNVFAQLDAFIYQQGQFTFARGNACIIDDNKLNCYCATPSGGCPNTTKLFENKSVTYFESNFHETYALTDNKIEYLGFAKESYVQESMPKLSRPRIIKKSGDGTCAIDDNGAHCWINRKDGKIEPFKMPLLKNPVQIDPFISTYAEGSKLFLWVLDDNGVQLFANEKLIYKLPFKNPTQFVADSSTVCAIDDEGLTCLSNRGFGDHYFNPATAKKYQLRLKNPRVVTMNFNLVCAAGDKEARCWEQRLGFPELKTPPLVDPTYIAISSDHDSKSVCAMDSEGLHCWWGAFTEGNMAHVTHIADAKRPIVRDPSFRLSQLDHYLNVLAKTTPAAKAQYFSELNRFVEANLMAPVKLATLNQARYMVALLISPAILSIESQYGVEVLIPKYKQSLIAEEKKLKLDNDISKMPPTPMNKLVALYSIYAAIKVLKEFQTLETRSQLADLNRTLGQAIADPIDTHIQTLINELDDLSALITSAQLNPKSAFLIDTINLAKEWLGRK